MKTQNKNYIRVLLFFIVGVALFALLGAQFVDTKGWFKQTYSLKLKSSDVGGIAVGAKVLMAGIQVGSVKEIYLGEDGTYGVIGVEINEKYKIRSDSVFSLQQAGFLGEQYVGVAAVENSQAEFLKSGDVLECEPPFSIAAIASSAKALMDSAKETSDSLHQVLDSVNAEILSDETITNIAGAIQGMNEVTHNVNGMVVDLKGTISDSMNAVKSAITNVDAVVTKFGNVADDVHEVASNNRENIALTFTNLSLISSNLNTILDGINNQKGVVGSIVYDENLKSSFQITMSNLVTLSSNLSDYGILRYPKAKKNKKEK